MCCRDFHFGFTYFVFLPLRRSSTLQTHSAKNSGLARYALPDRGDSGTRAPRRVTAVPYRYPTTRLLLQTLFTTTIGTGTHH
jgi:hypothetical protein